jgi:hypothetical protein
LALGKGLDHVVFLDHLANPAVVLDGHGRHLV